VHFYSAIFDDCTTVFWCSFALPFTYKEQDPEKVNKYLQEIAQLNKDDFVYIDESGIGKDTIQMDFWMKKGEIKKVKVAGKRAKRINAIAASTTKGIQAPFLYDGSCNSDLFIQYVEAVLCPILKPGQVVIMDNASFHKAKKVKELIEEKHCRLIYLPPYSPEHNPIEHYWAILKKAVKQVRKKIVDVWESISLAIELTQKFRQS